MKEKDGCPCFLQKTVRLSVGSKSLGLLFTTISSVWLHLQFVGLAKILFEFLEDFFFFSLLFDKTLWNLKTSEAVLKA